MIHRRITTVLTTTALAGAGILTALPAHAQPADAPQLAVTITKVDLHNFSNPGNLPFMNTPSNPNAALNPTYVEVVLSGVTPHDEEILTASTTAPNDQASTINNTDSSCAEIRAGSCTGDRAQGFKLWMNDGTYGPDGTASIKIPVRDCGVVPSCGVSDGDAMTVAVTVQQFVPTQTVDGSAPDGSAQQTATFRCAIPSYSQDAYCS